MSRRFSAVRTTLGILLNTPAPKIPCEQGYIQGNFSFPLGVTSLSGGRIKEIDPQRGELDQGASRELSSGLFPELHFPGVSTAVVPSGKHSPALLSVTDDDGIARLLLSVEGIEGLFQSVF